MGRKDSDWASLPSLLTQVKRVKGLKERRENEESLVKNAVNDERNCPTKIIIQVEWICFYQPGEHLTNMLKAYTKQKGLSWGLSACFLSPKNWDSPQTEVKQLCCSAPWYRLAIAFSGSLSDSFSPASRVHFCRQANKKRKEKKRKTFSSVSYDLESLVRWRTHDLHPLDR